VLLQNLFVVLVVVVTGLFQSQLVQAGEERGEGPDRRIVGGHQFQPSHRIIDPFVTTHVRTSTGAGIAAGFESPVIETAGDTLGVLKGDLAFFTLEFEYQQNLFGWGALRLALSGTGRAGIDEQSILADGITTVYGVLLQGKAVVLRDESSQVSVLATLSRKNIFGLDPFGFAQRVIDNGGLGTDNSLLQEADINRVSVGAAGAHAFAVWLGTSGFVEVGTAKPVSDDVDNETLFKGGIAGDFDLLPLRSVPLGISLAYDFDSFPEGGADVAKGVHSGTIGFNYTGRTDFHLGLEVVVSTLKQSDVESNFAATNFLLNLRYYF
jgi:hypothetical protein